MIAATAIAIMLFLASLTLHLAMLRLAKKVSPPGLAPAGLRLTGGSLLVLISHMLVAVVFAVGFAWAAVPRQHQWHRFEVVI